MNFQSGEGPKLPAPSDRARVLPGIAENAVPIQRGGVSRSKRGVWRGQNVFEVLLLLSTFLLSSK